ncbi:MAG: hypothetical protein A2298_04055 [Gammaproteobacteria bacterium RIFOXYB2_FULL_38_6]|nr:MAG: hypothetical protein A2298_04055 [Gammaproteobacteria bacterium RIFOXYB2_FULL_38_6]
MKLSLFPIFFLLEIAVFIIVGQAIGVLATLLLIILTTAFGFAILRQQGLSAAQKMYKAMQTHQPVFLEQGPDGLIVIAGILLIIPGFITDAMGLILLLPFVRKLIRQKWQMTRSAANESKHPPRIIEGEFKKDK